MVSFSLSYVQQSSEYGRARAPGYERALRMDERALTSARSGARACEGTRMFRYAGQDGSHQQCLCAA